MKKLVLIVCVLVTLVSVDASLTEKDFKRMKIRELQRFLDDRGLTCPGCQEKSDFVRVAFQNRDKKLAGSVERREVPDTTFWEAWSAKMKTTCTERVVLRGNDPTQTPYSSVCDALQMATDSFLMQHGKAVASKLKKKPNHLLKTSYKGVYYDAGERLLQKFVNHCLASSALQSKCGSLGNVLKLMEGSTVADYKQWVTNVGIENTNPMYEIVDDHGDL